MSIHVPAYRSITGGFDNLVLRIPSTPPLSPEYWKRFPIYMRDRSEGVLYVPARMTPADFDLLKTQIANALATIEATAVTLPAAPPTEGSQP